MQRFRQQRHRRIGKGVLQPFGHPNGAKGTVEPHRRRAQGLQGNNGGEQARPGAGFALPVHRQRQKYRQTGLPAGQQRRTGLRKPGQCFADQQIRAALLQSGRLDSIGIHQPVKGNPVAVPVFGVDREPTPARSPRSTRGGRPLPSQRTGGSGEATADWRRAVRPLTVQAGTKATGRR